MPSLRGAALSPSILLSVALTTWLLGCYSYVTVAPPLAEAIAEHQPTRIRATLSDSSIIQISEPRVDGDSIVGHWPPDASIAQPTAVSLAKIEELEQREISTARTIALIGAFVVPLTLLVIEGPRGY